MSALSSPTRAWDLLNHWFRSRGSWGEKLFLTLGIASLTCFSYMCLHCCCGNCLRCSRNLLNSSPSCRWSPSLTTQGTRARARHKGDSVEGAGLGGWRLCRLPILGMCVLLPSLGSQDQPGGQLRPSGRPAGRNQLRLLHKLGRSWWTVWRPTGPMRPRTGLCIPWLINPAPPTPASLHLQAGGRFQISPGKLLRWQSKHWEKGASQLHAPWPFGHTEKEEKK